MLYHRLSYSHSIITDQSLKKIKGLHIHGTFIWFFNQHQILLKENKILPYSYTDASSLRPSFNNKLGSERSNKTPTFFSRGTGFVLELKGPADGP